MIEQVKIYHSTQLISQSYTKKNSNSLESSRKIQRTLSEIPRLVETIPRGPQRNWVSWCRVTVCPKVEVLISVGNINSARKSDYFG